MMIPLRMIRSSMTPITVPMIVPKPPVSAVPPTTTMAMTSSSYPVPAMGAADEIRRALRIPANPSKTQVQATKLAGKPKKQGGKDKQAGFDFCCRHATGDCRRAVAARSQNPVSQLRSTQEVMAHHAKRDKPQQRGMDGEFSDVNAAREHPAQPGFILQWFLREAIGDEKRHAANDQ